MKGFDTFDRQKWVKFFTHLIVISMLFFLPEFLLNYASAHRHRSMEILMYEKSAVFVLVFYLNYYLIINKTLFGKRQNYFMFVLWNLLIILTFILGFYFIRPIFWDTPPPPKPHHAELPRMVQIIHGWSYILRDVVMLILTIALSAALRFAEKWSTLEKRHEQLLAIQRADELQNLKSQLNPHFFFNTLNTIYSLIDIDPKEAQNAIHMLSKLMRYVLYENEGLEPLSKEIDFIKTYISLMEMRLGPGSVIADFSGVEDDTIEIPSMIFLTLIENAFKHGNTGRKDEPIEITMSSDSSGHVSCSTFNHFDEARQADDRRKGGIGLTNLRRRLVLLYGNRAHLSTSVKHDTYTALLTIQTAPKS